MTRRHPDLMVIDTDGGGDDAAAILLALSDKNIAKVLAITCCFGNTDLDNACRNVIRTLTICKEREIPVYRGCRGPLICKEGHLMEMVFGEDGLGNVGHEFSTGGLKESDVPAPLALIQLAKENRQRINLVAIGPLTNIAIAHRIDPQFTKNLKSIVCMGGNYKGIGNISEVAEFNFYCDPEAAHIVLSEADCDVVLVPWETAPVFGIRWDTYDQLMKVETTKGQFVKRINEFYVERAKKKGNKRYCDADFMAVATLLYPHCIRDSIESKAVVECSGTYSRGLTILLRDAPGETTKKIKIVTSFDEEVLDVLRFQMLQE